MLLCLLVATGCQATNSNKAVPGSGRAGPRAVDERLAAQLDQEIASGLATLLAPARDEWLPSGFSVYFGVDMLQLAKSQLTTRVWAAIERRLGRELKARGIDAFAHVHQVAGAGEFTKRSLSSGLVGRLVVSGPLPRHILRRLVARRALVLAPSASS